MKRAQIVEAFKPLVIDTVDIPSPPAKGLVIKTVNSGICHSDLYQWEDRLDHGETVTHFTDIPVYNLPVTPGHEVAGVIHSLGSVGDEDATDELKVGDRVVVYPWMGCGQCGYCENKHFDKCPLLFMCLGSVKPGGYASFVVVPDKKFAVKLPQSVPFDLACMFACSTLTAYHAVNAVMQTVQNAGKIKGKAKLLIIGAGGLGLWGSQFASKICPSNCTVSVADINNKKLELAMERGCHETLLWDTSKTDEEIIKLSTKSGPYDAIIDFVNNSITSRRAHRCLNFHGIVIAVGLFGGEAKFSLPKFVFGHHTMQAVMIGSLEMMKELVKLAEKQNLVPPPLHKIKLEEVNTALQNLKDGKVEGRYIIEFPTQTSLI